MKLKKAKKYSEEIKKILLPISDKIEVVGSISRNHPEVKDIDIVLSSKPGKNILTHLKRFSPTGGEKHVVFKYKGVPVNIWDTPKNSFGATKLHFSKGKDILRIKRSAKDIDLKLTRYGLYKDDKYITGNDKVILKLLQPNIDRERFVQEGQYPRETANYFRFRQMDPKEFSQKTFRIRKTPSGMEILGEHKDGVYKTQSIMIKKRSLEKAAYEI